MSNVPMIAIKGMEMPSCCMMCDFCKEVPYTGELYCNITASDILNIREKLDDCPLVEIITCKDCEHNAKVCSKGYSEGYCEMHECVVSDDHFCFLAERKNTDADCD